jgi:outer membrane protein assembly factor BamB
MCLAALVHAGNWPAWRGPHANGVGTGKGYPVTWSDTESIDWKVALPGKGASTPIVWDGRIFVTCGIDGRNGVVCYGLEGKEQWRALIGQEVPGKNQKASGCNSSAATDGKHLFAYFKSGDLACLDMEGAIAWQHNLQEMYGEDTLWWDLGTSPVLTDRHVVVAVIHSGPSFLVAFEKQTGKQAWKHDRNLEAPSESAQTYATPVVIGERGKESLVVLGADHVTAHDASDGRELWRVGGLNPRAEMYFRSISSPVVSDGIVVAPYARGSTLTAIKLGGSGDVTKTHVVWGKSGVGADVPTPAASEGKVYLCGDRGQITCLDARTGKEVWSGNLERSRHAFSASPILADGKLYVTREDGTTFVLAQGPEFKLLATNHLADEFVVATPVPVDGKILIRTAANLYCIGK